MARPDSRKLVECARDEWNRSHGLIHPESRLKEVTVRGDDCILTTNPGVAYSSAGARLTSSARYGVQAALGVVDEDGHVARPGDSPAAVGVPEEGGAFFDPGDCDSGGREGECAVDLLV